MTQKGRDGKLQTITLVVEGPVCVVACTTKESVYEDNANRSILIYLDDSREQDEAVMGYQKRHRAGLVDRHGEQQAQRKLQHMQKALEPIRVTNPYAPLIDLPEGFPKKRRALPILLNFMEAITFYHQYQRAQLVDSDTGEIYIESTPEDIGNGFTYLKKVLCRRSDDLDGATRDFYEVLKQTLEKHGLQKFKVSDIRQHIRLTPRSIQGYLKNLAEYGYVQITGGKQRTGYEYETMSATTQTQMEQGIEAHIKQVMGKVGKAHAKRQKAAKPLPTAGATA
ncbi:hypothetical protein [Parasediminibacterium sp. JCM 36343]|uniref:hypothetical protein n=1 Tax=Parasediminibacterium sp. JCM 36343 TaxID=3374279 RepID=UPI00397DE881